MSDKRPKHLQKNEVQKKAIEKSTIKLEAIRAVKALDNGDSKWNLVQDILQDIMAGYIVANPNAQPPVTEMREHLLKEINLRHKDEEDLKNLLIESVPEVRSIRKWVKKEGWEEAVWDKIRGDQLFSPANRAQVLEAVRTRAIDKSDQAAKLWLTISGDYSDKLDVTDKTVETYREINNILHKKKKQSE